MLSSEDAAGGVRALGEAGVQLRSCLVVQGVLDATAPGCPQLRPPHLPGTALGVVQVLHYVARCDTDVGFTDAPPRLGRGIGMIRMVREQSPGQAIVARGGVEAVRAPVLQRTRLHVFRYLRVVLAEGSTAIDAARLLTAEVSPDLPVAACIMCK